MHPSGKRGSRPAMCVAQRCGNDAPWKAWKTQKASFPLFPPRLEIRQKAPDSHISTAPTAAAPQTQLSRYSPYNLSQVLKANLLPPEYRQVSAATLRWKLYRVPGKLVRHARAWVLKVRTEGEKLALLEAARHRCNELSVSSA